MRFKLKVIIGLQTLAIVWLLLDFCVTVMIFANTANSDSFMATFWSYKIRSSQKVTIQLLITVGLKGVYMKIIPPNMRPCGSFLRNQEKNIPGLS